MKHPPSVISLLYVVRQLHSLQIHYSSWDLPYNDAFDLDVGNRTRPIPSNTPKSATLLRWGRGKPRRKHKAYCT